MIQTVLAILVALALGPLPVCAQEDPDALIEQGLAFREQGRDEEALPLFERAYARQQSARALAQVALAEQALGRWVVAERHLAEALRSSEPWVVERRAPLEAALATIREHLGTLELAGGVPGAEVRINGERAGVLPLAEPLRVIAGSVAIEVTADGYSRFQRTVTVPPGGHAREPVALVLRAAVDAPPDRAPDEPVPSAAAGEWRPGDLLWVGTAATVIGLACGITFGLFSWSEISNFDAQPSHEAADRALVFAVIADIGFGLAVVGGVLAIVGFLNGGTVPGPQPRTVSVRGGRFALLF